MKVQNRIPSQVIFGQLEKLLPAAHISGIAPGKDLKIVASLRGIRLQPITKRGEEFVTEWDAIQLQEQQEIARLEALKPKVLGDYADHGRQFKQLRRKKRRQIILRGPFL